MPLKIKTSLQLQVVEVGVVKYRAYTRMENVHKCTGCQQKYTSVKRLMSHKCPVCKNVGGLLVHTKNVSNISVCKLYRQTMNQGGGGGIRTESTCASNVDKVLKYDSDTKQQTVNLSKGDKSLDMETLEVHEQFSIRVDTTNFIFKPVNNDWYHKRCTQLKLYTDIQNVSEFSDQEVPIGVPIN